MLAALPILRIAVTKNGPHIYQGCGMKEAGAGVEQVLIRPELHASHDAVEEIAVAMVSTQQSKRRDPQGLVGGHVEQVTTGLIVAILHDHRGGGAVSDCPLHR